MENGHKLSISRLKISVTAVLLCLAGIPAQRFSGFQSSRARNDGTVGPPGETASYRLKDATSAGSTVSDFTLTLGKAEHSDSGDRQWVSLSATKVDGQQFRMFLLCAGYPAVTLKAARAATSRYIFQEGSSAPREYRNALTGQAELPALGGWDNLFPRPVPESRSAGVFPQEMRYLGLFYT